MRKRGSPRRRALRILTVLILILLAAALVLGRPYLRRLQRALAAVHTERAAGHDILFRELNDVARLHTVQYRYRTVFPFDYMPEEITLAGILARLRTEDRRYEDAVTERERDYLAAYNLVHRHGIGARGGAEFVVLDVLVSAGFAFDRGDDSPSAPPPLAIQAAVESDSADPKRSLRVATVTLPPPAVTEVRIADIDPETYPYPEVALSPAAYREIAAYVRERAGRRVIERGILERAEQSGRRLIEQLLLGAGFDRVRFTRPALYTPQLR